MKTIAELLSLSTAFLQEKGVSQPRRQVEDLLAHCLKVQRLDLYLQYDRPLEEKEIALFRETIRRKSLFEPLEYILEKVFFYHCELHINRSVLIPRPETEILVDQIVQQLKKQNLCGKILWDVCSGSGCIGIAIKKALPALTVALSDLSQDALSLAAENARLNGVEVELRHGDLLEPFSGEKADYIVSNPPYVSQKEYLALDRSVVNFEPKMALIGGERGTEFYERLSSILPQHLKEGSSVFLEIGETQGLLLKKIFSNSFWGRSALYKDWAGKDRFFFLEKQ